jgi:flagellar operon protein
MEIKKLSPFENVSTPEKRPQATSTSGGPSFAEALGKIQDGESQAAPGLQALQQALTPAPLPAADAVKFSNHAIERMMTRGIQFNKEDMNRLNEAVQRAASKGAKDSLILMNDSALIVSVKNKTVVTVMDKNALKENVFTNIDSTIVM